MITKISSPRFCGVQKNSTSNAKNSNSKNYSNIAYKSSFDEAYKQQQKNALGLSLTTIFGALLFMFGYFIFANLRNGKLS